jgi:hypothetical protein
MRARTGANGHSGGAHSAHRHPARRERDPIDYEHRHFVNLAAFAFVLGLGICIGWTIKMFDAHQTLERCIASGRKDCVTVAAPPARTFRHLIH